MVARRGLLSVVAAMVVRADNLKEDTKDKDTKIRRVYPWGSAPHPWPEAVHKQTAVTQTPKT